jgi:hypothetical protein
VLIIPGSSAAVEASSLLCSLSLSRPAYRFVCGHPGGGLSGAEAPAGGRFIKTYRQCIKCLTTRCAANRP